VAAAGSVLALAVLLEKLSLEQQDSGIAVLTAVENSWTMA
jgi:hypothetical protein